VNIEVRDRNVASAVFVGVLKKGLSIPDTKIDHKHWQALHVICGDKIVSS